MNNVRTLISDDTLTTPSTDDISNASSSAAPPESTERMPVASHENDTLSPLRSTRSITDQNATGSEVSTTSAACGSVMKTRPGSGEAAAAGLRWSNGMSNASDRIGMMNREMRCTFKRPPYAIDRRKDSRTDVLDARPDLEFNQTVPVDKYVSSSLSVSILFDLAEQRPHKVHYRQRISGFPWISWKPSC